MSKGRIYRDNSQTPAQIAPAVYSSSEGMGSTSAAAASVVGADVAAAWRPSCLLLESDQFYKIYEDDLLHIVV